MAFSLTRECVGHSNWRLAPGDSCCWEAPLVCCWGWMGGRVVLAVVSQRNVAGKQPASAPDPAGNRPDACWRHPPVTF